MVRTLPPLTPEQRTQALVRAKEARTARAGIKTRLRAGTMTLADVLADGSDITRKMKVTALLESLPGIGPVRARQIMAGIGIAANRRVRGLGERQRAALEQEFPADFA